MKVKQFCALALILVLVSLLLPGTAFAGPDSTTTVATQIEDEILWVAASIGADADSLEIRIITPQSRKGRSLFQRCTFTFQGMGEYLCGIDVGRGSAASKMEGAWKTKVLVDGAVAERSSFSL